MNTENNFPVITSGKYHTQGGNIYILHDDIWYPNVNYLAAVPTQYGCKTYEEQFNYIIRKIENGSLRAQASGKGLYMKDGRLYQYAA
ncbi:hypothetical protein ACNASG_21265 [Klebsiella pneumoniae]|uniref:hypothetical protein n=1 Tax=Klebsiella pneumoniae TaxID=573 RepID=UPI002A071AB1|nr:hypothetical protein [Klebsiella pneumoniae]EJD3765211.1 hypothetical protein [Klebsiella pneumoniae]MCJ4736978.1 hypothetical protein [Klebsiella pneumoniae]